MSKLASSAGTSTVPSFESLHVQVQTGEGIVARFPGLVLVTAVESTGTQRLLEICRDVSAARPRAPGRPVARRIAGWLANVDEPVDFGMVAASDDALAVFLCGRACLLVPGEDALSGAAAAAWVDRLIPWPSGSFLLTLGGGQATRPMPLLDLRIGAVPGEGLRLDPPATAVAPASPAPPAPSASPTPSAPPAGEPHPTLEPPLRAEPIMGVPPDEKPREPLPKATGEQEPHGASPPEPGQGVLAEGFLCSRGHLNNPRARFCATCGIRMAERTGVIVTGIRPPLGLLVFDDGTSFTLDEDYLLGRQPDVDERVRDGSLRPLMVDDQHGLVSRAHLEIQLREWDVYLNDTGSANGTFVATPGAPAWSALVPGQPLRLPPGTRVSIGSRWFVFESGLAR
ncbi:MAG: FHA domain-containing protein [Pseudonocardiaceae bacterium]